jgi:hypothetical protein
MDLNLSIWQKNHCTKKKRKKKRKKEKENGHFPTI